MTKPAVPNNNARPSSIWNDALLAPFVGLAPGENLELGDIPEETSLGDPNTGEAFTPQGPHNNLRRFRADFPYVPIIPWPREIRTIVLAQNAARDIEVPDTVTAVFLRSSGNYYASNHGNAEIPIDGTSKSAYKPDGIMFYTGGIRTISLISPDVGGCIVTLMGYAPLEWPRFG